MSLPDLPGRLAALRRKAGLSQEDLARELDVERSTVSNIERGRRDPSLEVLMRYSRIFGVSVDSLLYGESAAPDVNDEKLLLHFKQLSKRDQREILALIELKLKTPPT